MSELKFTRTVQWMAPLFQLFFSGRTSSKPLFHFKFEWTLPVKSRFCFLIKQKYMWLRVNLTHSHVTKRLLDVTNMKHLSGLLSKQWVVRTRVLREGNRCADCMANLVIIISWVFIC